MTLDTFLLIVLIQTGLSASVAIMSFVLYKKRDSYIKLLGLSFLIGSLSNILIYLLPKVNLSYLSDNILTFYGVANFLLIASVYKKQLGGRGWIYIILSIVFVSFTIVDSFYIQSTSMDTYSMTLESVVVIILTISFFFKLLKNLPVEKIQHLPMFWINAGYLIYASGSFFLFAMTDYLIHVLKNNLLYYWSFHNVLSIIQHLIIQVGLYNDLKKLK